MEDKDENENEDENLPIFIIFTSHGSGQQNTSGPELSHHHHQGICSTLTPHFVDNQLIST